MNNRLLNIRKTIGYTQNKFSEFLGISLRAYINYENYDRDIPSNVLQIISKLGINIDWLLTGEGPQWNYDIAQPNPLGKISEPPVIYSDPRDRRIAELEKENASLREVIKKIDADISEIKECPIRSRGLIPSLDDT